MSRVNCVLCFNRCTITCATENQGRCKQCVVYQLDNPDKKLMTGNCKLCKKPCHMNTLSKNDNKCSMCFKRSIHILNYENKQNRNCKVCQKICDVDILYKYDDCCPTCRKYLAIGSRKNV